MKKALYIFAILFTVFISACKKDKIKSDDDTGDLKPSKDGSTLDLMRDSVFLYAKETYYWYDGLPTYSNFNPRSITAGDDLSALSKEVDLISQYKINPVTNKPFEYYAPSPGSAKYSFIDAGEVSTQLNGTQGDFGFAPLYNDVNDLRVKYVYPGSPADLAGIKRGYKITSINGNTNLSYDGSSGTRTKFVINAYTNSATITMVLEKPNGTSTTVTLNVANYTLNPVLTYKTIDGTNGRTVGYIVFNSFTSDANADARLSEAFNYFTTNGVTDLVVDLRYNGGGYVSTSEYLANLIVPAAKSGSVMYNTYFNSILASGQGKILANQVRRDPGSNKVYNYYSEYDYSVAKNQVKFSKTGSLNISRIFFIVTGSTASASELLINNLRPYVDVKLIGSTTYGKPVGFFDIKINKYEMYIPEFETKNSSDQGGYYAGMEPGSVEYPGKSDYDDATKDFGDPTEGLLAHALNFVKTGNYSVAKPQIQGLSTQLKTFSVQQANDAAIELNQNKFSGMIFNKPLKLK